MIAKVSPAVSQVRAVKTELSQRLLQVKTPAGQGIVGIGVGEKRTAGRLTGLRCVTVLVRAKRAARALSARQLLPAEIAGVRIDVQQVGKLEYGPGGESIRPAVVTDGTHRFELHCAHTVSPHEAFLSIPLLAVSSVDCALIKAGVKETSQLSERLLAGQAEFDMPVWFHASFARYAAGIVASVDTDISLTYAGKRVIFANQIVIIPYGQHAFDMTPCAGSLIVGRVTAEAVGIIIGGSRKIAIANHMDDVLDALGVRFRDEVPADAQFRPAEHHADEFPAISAEQFQPCLLVRASSVPNGPAGTAPPRRLAP